MKLPIKKLFNKDFYSSTTLVLLGTNLGNLLNFLFHLLLTRLIDPNTYGLFQSLTGLTAYLGIFLSTFSLYIIFQINQSTTTTTSLVRRFHRITFSISLISWLTTIISYPFITSFLHLGHPLPYFLFSLLPLLIPLPLLYQSLFRAQLQFLPFTVLSLLGSFLKLTLSALALLLHPSLNTLLAAIALSLTLTSISAYFWFQKTPLQTSLPSTSPPSSLSFLILAFISQLSLISLYTSDTLLVRHFFSPHQSGIYSAAITLGKIIFFLTTPLLAVAFPFFTQDSSSQRRRHLLHSVLITFFLSSLAFLTIKIRPQPLVNLLLGQSFSSSSQLVPSISLYMLALVLLNLFSQYLLSQKKLAAALIPAITAFLQIILTIFHHPTLNSVIFNSLTAILIGLTLSLYPILNPLLKNMR